MGPTHCAPFPGSTRVLKLGKSGFRRCSGKLHPPDVGVTRGHPSTTPLGCESLALASCYSDSCIVGQRLERNGTAPPSGHGCASRSSLRAGFAKELHSKGDIIFWKKQLSSEPGATLSLKPWLSGLLLWEVLVDVPDSDLAILLDFL